MKKYTALFTVLVLMVLCATPVFAAGLSISPPLVEFDVLADGEGQVEFTAYDFDGELEVSLENIPLRVEPTTIPVSSKEGGTKVILTFYGDKSLGPQVFNGKIRFLAMTGRSVAMGIKIRAVVNHIAPELPPEEQTSPGEVSAPVLPPKLLTPPTSPPSPLLLPPAPTETNEFPIVPIVGIAAGLVIVVTTIIIFGRRRSRY